MDYKTSIKHAILTFKKWSVVQNYSIVCGIFFLGWVLLFKLPVEFPSVKSVGLHANENNLEYVSNTQLQTDLYTSEVALLKDTEALVLPTRWNVTVYPDYNLLNPSDQPIEKYLSTRILIKNTQPTYSVSNMHSSQWVPSEFLNSIFTQPFKYYGHYAELPKAKPLYPNNIRIYIEINEVNTSKPQMFQQQIELKLPENLPMILFQPIHCIAWVLDTGLIEGPLMTSRTSSEGWDRLLMEAAHMSLLKARVPPGYYELTLGL